MIVEYRSGELWMRQTRLYAEERAELVQKMGKASLMYGFSGFPALDGGGVGEVGG